MRGSLHSNDPEETMRRELWVGYPEWMEPCDVDPDERDPEGGEAKGRGLDTKRYQAR